MDTRNVSSGTSQLVGVIIFELLVIAIFGVTGAMSAPGARPASPTPLAAAFRSASSSDSVLQQTVANMRAARLRHDIRAYHMFRAELVERIGPEQVRAALDQYRVILANLDEATRRHDSQARQRYRLQISQLCGPGTLVSGPDHCDIAIAATRI
jgi:hypothetical protein